MMKDAYGSIVTEMSEESRIQMNSALRQPMSLVPPRRPGSARRTSHIDIVHLETGFTLDGMARDLVTPLAGERSSETIRISANSRVHALLDANATLLEISSDPQPETLKNLLGLAVRQGFRDAIRQHIPDHVALGTPLALLLDDLPVASLISGYALLYSGRIPVLSISQAVKADICSGWRTGGTMLASVAAGTGIPTPLGPDAPVVAQETSADPVGWHHLSELPAGAMRRRRLVDVQVKPDEWNIIAMFRDTHVSDAGKETVLHEYSLTATVDPQTMRFLTCAAVPRVLPWIECPVAASSADTLVGLSCDEIREHVRQDLQGVRTCTHLNDLLRSLGDVRQLAELVKD